MALMLAIDPSDPTGAPASDPVDAAAPEAALEPGPVPAADARVPAADADPESAHRETPYADALERYIGRAPVQLMVPGHGGNREGLSARLADFVGERILALDIPMLIDDVDLGDSSPFERALALAADAWGARRTWFLTNGASQANRTAALAVRGLGRHIVSQRSAHSSFSDGVLVAGLLPAFVLPGVDTRNGIAHGVSPEALDRVLRDEAAAGRAAAAVYIVSPSYFGAVSDVAALAETAHRHGAPLIVDGAWGPHFGFHPELPESPVRMGADLVISSTHKLGGSLTQSAMLHLGSGPFADRLEALIERAFTMTASTSSSALMRASLDIARHALVTGTDQIGVSIAAADRFRDALRADPRFAVVSDGFDAYADVSEIDPLRVVIDVSRSGASGHEVRQRLIDRHGIFFEMSTGTTLVAVIGAGKTPDYDRVFRALVDTVDEFVAERSSRGAGSAAGSIVPIAQEFPALPAPGAIRVSPREGFFGDTELVPAGEAIGRVSADALAAYPPGIPNVMPGEEITAETVRFLQAVASSPSGYVRGAVDPEVRRMRVLRDL